MTHFFRSLILVPILLNFGCSALQKKRSADPAACEAVKSSFHQAEILDPVDVRRTDFSLGWRGKAVEVKPCLVALVLTSDGIDNSLAQVGLRKSDGFVEVGSRNLNESGFKKIFSASETESLPTIPADAVELLILIWRDGRLHSLKVQVQR